MPVRDDLPTEETISERFGVAGKTAVVTGASSGIGRAVAETFVADGADVVICSRTQDDVDAVADELNSSDLPGAVLPVECDVTDRDSVAALADATVEEFGTVDILVNNAGGAGEGAPLHEVDPEEWDGVVDVNLTGTFNVSRAFADALRDDGADEQSSSSSASHAQQNGAVVNTSSMAGRYGVSGMDPYSAAKAGVSNLTRTLARDWADDDVRVNAVEPGFIATGPVREKFGLDGIPGRESVDRDMGTPHEVADTIRFLASDAASFITGQTIAPTGPPHTFTPPEA